MVQKRGERILVADDNASIRRILCHILQQAGFATVEARDGKEAIQMLEKDRPDMVILDVMMPHIDGFTACHMIKSNPKLETLPVLICTSRDRKADVLRAISAGADDYIIKPFNREFILTRVRRALVPKERRAPTLDEAHERRAHPRVKADWSVTWTAQRSTGTRLMFKNRIRNISVAGVGVSYIGGQTLDDTDSMEESLPCCDDAVDLVLEIDRATVVEARGRVVHVTPASQSEAMLVGIGFTELPAAARDAIQRHTY